MYNFLSQARDVASGKGGMGKAYLPPPPSLSFSRS